MVEIRANKVRFFAFHGCHPEERKTGGYFEVDICVRQAYDGSDELASVADYVSLMAIAESEMKEAKNLIEAVAWRIASGIKARFDHVTFTEVTVRKLKAPVSYEHESVSATITM